MSYPLRTDTMGIVFIHEPCGHQVTCVTQAPINQGVTCTECDPDFDYGPTTDWRMVLKDDPDAAEIGNRWRST